MSLTSIITPIYNAEKFLPKCLDSIINQTYKNLEIILVNDGSADKSGEICDKYAVADSRIKVIHKKNGGVSSARNDGLASATGEYIAFVDSDDWIETTMLERLYDLCLKYESPISMCGYYIERLGKMKNSDINLPSEGTLNQEKALENILIPVNFEGFLCNKMFSLRLIKKNHLKLNEQIHFCEDLLFVCEAVKNCEYAAYTTEPLYHYFLNESSATQNVNEKFLSGITAYKLISEKIQDSSHPELAKGAFVNYSSSLYLNIFNTIFNTKKLKRELKGYINDNEIYFWKYPFPRKSKIMFLGVKYFPAIFPLIWYYLKKIKNLIGRVTGDYN